MTKSTHQLTCLAFVLGFSMLASVQATDGSIQFSGGLYAPPCKVSIDTQTTLNERQFVQVHLSDCDNPVRASLSTPGTTSASAKMRVVHSQAVISLPLAAQSPRAMIVTLEYI
jgi:type 1 fimbria pilin